jgi:uncharacterized protein (TIGR02001 family)
MLEFNGDKIMIKSRAVLAGSLLAIAGAASAEISITPTLTSDYDFRGITQSSNDPAFQLGLTYTGETGMYFGLWGSNVDFDITPASQDPYGPSTEIDVFAGYAGGDPEEGIGYDLGAIYYAYPNAGAGNFPEVYAGMSKGFFSAKVWYSWNFNASGDTAYYADINLNMPAAEGFSIISHIGHSGGEYWSGTGGSGKYMDWSAGFAFEAKGATMTFKYVDGSDQAVNPRNLGRFVFSISTTLSSGD